MVRFPESAYVTWRSAALDQSFLKETHNGAPSEHLLHLVWQHQRLHAPSLFTTGGRPVQVLHPGFWNHAQGPDFRDAVVRIGSDRPTRGDIEIDLRDSDWTAHRHRDNPDYHRVILHVVWHPPSSPASPLPVLVLKNRLDAPLDELMGWVDLDPGLPDNVIGRCASRLSRIPVAALSDMLLQAALFRFHRKALELEVRARQVGWDQSLWEGLCGALGYQHNVWPMRRLAEQRARLQTGPDSSVLTQLQARLLGFAGLLPHETKGKCRGCAPYLRQLWDCWWRERDVYEASNLPGSLWRLGGVRPANHPQRRVALTAHWLLRKDWVQRLEQWLVTSVPPSRLAPSLLAELQADDDPFWSRHWTLTSAPMASPRPLLGTERASDLAINVILPWFWIRAEAGTGIRDEVVRRYTAWPAGQDNTVLRLARLRLFAGNPRPIPWTAARQQGLLQIVRDFCGHSNALCDNCVLPAQLQRNAP